jgi:methyl-accepting chemotaxis protein
MSYPSSELEQLHELLQVGAPRLRQEITEVNRIAKGVTEEVNLLGETLPYISAGMEGINRKISYVSSGLSRNDLVEVITESTKSLLKELQKMCKRQVPVQTCTTALQYFTQAINYHEQQNELKTHYSSYETRSKKQNEKAMAEVRDIMTICNVYQQQALQLCKNVTEAYTKSQAALEKEAKLTKTVTEIGINIKLYTQSIPPEEVTVSHEKLTQVYENVAKAFELAIVYKEVAATYEVVATEYRKKITKLQQHIDAYTKVADAHGQLAEASDDLLKLLQKHDNQFSQLVQALEEKARSCKLCASYYEQARLVRVLTISYTFWSMKPSLGQEDKLCCAGIKVVLKRFFDVKFFTKPLADNSVIHSPFFRQYGEILYLLPPPAKGAEKLQNCPKLYRPKT